MPTLLEINGGELAQLANTTEPMEHAYREAHLQLYIQALCKVMADSQALGAQTLDMTLVLGAAIDSLARLQKTRKFAGLYAQVYNALLQQAEELVARGAEVTVIYQIMAPIILCLNTSLYSQPAVMPLAQLETDLKVLGYEPSPVHTVYTGAART